MFVELVARPYCISIWQLDMFKLPRLICVSAGNICHFVGYVVHGSDTFISKEFD